MGEGETVMDNPSSCPNCTATHHGQLIKVRSFKNPLCSYCGKRVYAISIETEEGLHYNSLTKEAKVCMIDVIKTFEGNLKKLKGFVN